MKYLKTYENLNQPEIGDYVKINVSAFNLSKFSSVDGKIVEFFNEEIGKITEIDERELNINGYPYKVVFTKKIPNSSLGPSDYFMAFNIKELLGWAPNLEDLKIKISTRKYNL